MLGPPSHPDLGSKRWKHLRGRSGGEAGIASYRVIVALVGLDGARECHQGMSAEVVPKTGGVAPIITCEAVIAESC